MNHEGQVHDWVAGQACLEAVCMPAQQVASEESPMTAATHCHSVSVHDACISLKTIKAADHYLTKLIKPYII